MSLSDATRSRIQELVGSSPVFLFMKGTPQAPQCGFSARVVSILGRLVPAFGSHDVLSDPEVREGIKEFSEWPTIPQLYVNGEFMGGCDIIEEMYASGELHQALGMPAPEPAKAPELALSEKAAELLRDAQRRAGEGEFHLSIDPHFEATLGIGPAQPGQIRAEAQGIAFHLDPESAARANGVSIDVVETAEGVRLTIDNPNAPAVDA